MYLVFDTETTGFPNDSLDRESKLQAHIVQIACLLIGKDFQEIGSFYTLIKPELFDSIHPGAEAAHGISLEDCNEHGIPIKTALNVFMCFYSKAKFNVAHNVKFDTKMIAIDSGQVIARSNDICTMETTTNVCQLPGKYGKYKWPKLQEAHEFLFKEKFNGAHDALSDVKATAKILKWLVENKKVG